MGDKQLKHSGQVFTRKRGRGFDAPTALRRKIKSGLCQVCNQLLHYYFFIAIDGKMKIALSERPVSRVSNVKSSCYFCENQACARPSI